MRTGEDMVTASQECIIKLGKPIPDMKQSAAPGGVGSRVHCCDRKG